MMFYLLVAGAVMVGLLLFGRWFAGADVKQLARALRWFVGGLAAAIAVYLILTGRWLLLLPIAAGIALINARLRSGTASWPRFKSPGRSSGSRSSTIETRFLRMSLDHDSGVMTGVVREGPHAGDIGRLSLDDLLDILKVCRVDDPQSVQVLEAFLDRKYSDWREQADDSAAPKRSGMTREEACRILGVEPNATAERIRDAHRHLMAGVHPDRGGSDYLAAEINRAKDVLLGS